ncbi:hypothetical protein [Marinagarivorans algicola]|nr:hypothetical protein [Marinagarivorans algicola]
MFLKNINTVVMRWVSLGYFGCRYDFFDAILSVVVRYFEGLLND